MEDFFTEKVQELLYHSMEFAKNSNHYQVDICHFLKSFLEDSNSLLNNVLSKLGINSKRVLVKVDEYHNTALFH